MDDPFIGFISVEINGFEIPEWAWKIWGKHGVFYYNSNYFLRNQRYQIIKWACEICEKKFGGRNVILIEIKFEKIMNNEEYKYNE